MGNAQVLVPLKTLIPSAQRRKEVSQQESQSKDQKGNRQGQKESQSKGQQGNRKGQQEGQNHSKQDNGSCQKESPCWCCKEEEKEVKRPALSSRSGYLSDRLIQNRCCCDVVFYMYKQLG